MKEIRDKEVAITRQADLLCPHQIIQIYEGIDCLTRTQSNERYGFS